MYVSITEVSLAALGDGSRWPSLVFLSHIFSKIVNIHNNVQNYFRIEG